MPSPGNPQRAELQLLADSAEQWQVNRYVREHARPLRVVMEEIVSDALRAATAMARLERTLELMPAPRPHPAA